MPWGAWRDWFADAADDCELPVLAYRVLILIAAHSASDGTSFLADGFSIAWANECKVEPREMERVLSLLRSRGYISLGETEQGQVSLTALVGRPRIAMSR